MIGLLSENLDRCNLGRPDWSGSEAFHFGFELHSCYCNSSCSHEKSPKRGDIRQPRATPWVNATIMPLGLKARKNDNHATGRDDGLRSIARGKPKLPYHGILLAIVNLRSIATRSTPASNLLRTLP